MLFLGMKHEYLSTLSSFRALRESIEEFQMRVSLSVLAIVVVACVPSNGSKVKHEWSKVRRDGLNSMIQKCEYGQLPTSAKLDKATKYLQKLGKHISDNVTKSFENDGMKSPFFLESFLLITFV